MEEISSGICQFIKKPSGIWKGVEEQGYPAKLLLLKSLARRMIWVGLNKEQELIASTNHLANLGSSCLDVRWAIPLMRHTPGPGRRQQAAHLGI